LRERYKRPFMIVEGRSVGKEEVAEKLPIYDVMVSLIKELKIPVVAMNDASDTAAFLVSLAKAEMSRMRSSERIDADEEISKYQLRMIQGLPNVTSVVAERLLQRFGSVQRIFSATPDELMSVDGVGKAIAEGIQKIATAKFRKL